MLTAFLLSPIFFPEGGGRKRSAEQPARGPPTDSSGIDRSKPWRNLVTFPLFAQREANRLRKSATVRRRLTGESVAEAPGRVTSRHSEMTRIGFEALGPVSRAAYCWLAPLEAVDPSRGIFTQCFLLLLSRCRAGAIGHVAGDPSVHQVTLSVAAHVHMSVRARLAANGPPDDAVRCAIASLSFSAERVAPLDLSLFPVCSFFERSLGVRRGTSA